MLFITSTAGVTVPRFEAVTERLEPGIAVVRDNLREVDYGFFAPLHPLAVEVVARDPYRFEPEPIGTYDVDAHLDPFGTADVGESALDEELTALLIGSAQ